MDSVIICLVAAKRIGLCGVQSATSGDQAAHRGLESLEAALAEGRLPKLPPGLAVGRVDQAWVSHRFLGGIWERFGSRRIWVVVTTMAVSGRAYGLTDVLG